MAGLLYHLNNGFQVSDYKFQVRPINAKLETCNLKPSSRAYLTNALGTGKSEPTPKFMKSGPPEVWLMYQVVSEGRKTAASNFPSPS